jgi:hypothetical protein
MRQNPPKLHEIEADGAREAVISEEDWRLNLQRIYYNCTCDEHVSLRCSNQGCEGEISPGSTMIVATDGTVFCSERCAKEAPAGKA